MKKENSAPPSRRNFLTGTSLAVAAAAAGSSLASKASAQAAQTPPRAPSALGASSDRQLFWEVETTHGKVLGMANTGIKEFKGIPYGASTGGKNRYMPPKKPTAWTGVRECFGIWPDFVRRPSRTAQRLRQMIQWDLQPGGMGEDCLALNVWTPGVNDGGKRPVMVSFHGGGFATGSGNAPAYDGTQLAQFGDVVVVTVNHRLASFGYLHLADLGAPPEFAHAGVVRA